MDSLSILSVTRCKPSGLPVLQVIGNYLVVAALWTVYGCWMAASAVVRAFGVRS